MHEIRLTQIANKLEVLRARDPRCEVLAYANYHGYFLNPPADEATVEEWEFRYGIPIPSEYREFILRLGNGGAGPYGGIYPLRVPDERLLDWAEEQHVPMNSEQHPLWCSVQVHKFSSNPTHHYRFNADRVNLSSAYGEFEDTAIEVGNEYSDNPVLLVASGPHVGEIWGLYEEDFTGFYHHSPIPVEDCEYGRSPFSAAGNRRLSFLDCYEHWLDAGLKWFE